MTGESLARALGERPFRFFPSLDSTNAEARRWLQAAAGARAEQRSAFWQGGGRPVKERPQPGAVVVADEQTAGRGRFSRGWLTPPGAAIAMSILLRDVAPGRISPAAGLAVSDAITPLVDAKVSLKWPNDVEITGRKVAGILSESINACGAQWFIVGIGINVDVDFTVDGGQRLEGERAPGKAEDLSEQATSISAHRAASRGPVDREALIATVASSLEGRLSEEELLAAWKEHLTTIGQTVKIGSPTGVVEGTAVDVDNEGRLVLQDARGRLRSFAAGDVTVVA